MSLDWGTVPAWVGSILTGGSLFVGASILCRDRIKHESDQARQVVCWTVPDLTDGWSPAVLFPNELQPIDVHIANSSNSIINRAKISYTVDARQRKAIKAWEQANAVPFRPYEEAMYTAFVTLGAAGDELVLGAGDEKVERQIHLPRPLAYMILWVRFKDGHGQEWMFDFKTKRLSRANPRRVLKRQWREKLRWKLITSKQVRRYWADSEAAKQTGPAD